MEQLLPLWAELSTCKNPKQSIHVLSKIETTAINIRDKLYHDQLTDQIECKFHLAQCCRMGKKCKYKHSDNVIHIHCPYQINGYLCKYQKNGQLCKCAFNIRQRYGIKLKPSLNSNTSLHTSARLSGCASNMKQQQQQQKRQYCNINDIKNNTSSNDIDTTVTTKECSNNNQDFSEKQYSKRTVLWNG